MLCSLLIAQLERIRKAIQDAKYAKEKKRLEEEERKHQEELARLLRQQAEEKKRMEALEAKRQKEQNMVGKLNSMGPCSAGYSWYKVLADFAEKEFISRCVRSAAVGLARGALISCPMQKQMLFKRSLVHLTEIVIDCVSFRKICCQLPSTLFTHATIMSLIHDTRVANKFLYLTGHVTLHVSSFMWLVTCYAPPGARCT